MKAAAVPEELDSPPPAFIRSLWSKLTGSQLRRNMFSGVVFSAIGAGLTTIGYPVYLHILGYEQYGLWLVLATVITFSQIGNLGISQALAKHIAEEHSIDNKQGIQQYTTSAIYMVGAVGLLLVPASLLLRHWFVHLIGLSGHNAEMAIQLLPCVAAFSVYVFIADISNNVLNGLGRNDLCAACQLISQAASLLFAIILLSLDFGVKGLLVAAALGCLLAHAVSTIWAHRITGFHSFSWRSWNHRHARQLLGFGGWLVGSSLISMMLTPFNRVVLARYGGLAAVPIYDIAFNISMRVRALAEVAQRSLTVEVSRLSASATLASIEQVRRIIKRAKRMLWATLPMFGLLFILATPLLKLWLGTRYSPQLPDSLRITLVAAFVSLLGTPAYYLMLGLGRPRIVFGAFLTQSAVNCCLVGFLILSGHQISAQAILVTGALGMGVATTYLLWREKSELAKL